MKQFIANYRTLGFVSDPFEQGMSLLQPGKAPLHMRTQAKERMTLPVRATR